MKQQGKGKSSRKRPTKKSPVNEVFTEHGKIPPQAVDFEEVLLGTIIMYPDLIARIGDIVKPEIFYKEAHQRIFQSFLDLLERDEPIDELAVINHLRSTEQLDLIGGAYYISLLLTKGSNINIEYYSKIIFQKYVQREIIHLGSNMIKVAYEDQIDCFEQIDTFTEGLERFKISSLTNKSITALSLTEKFNESIQNVKQSDEIIIGYNTGWNRFDSSITTAPDKIITLASKPGAGKTKFVSCYVFKLLEEYPDVAVRWFSFEDSAQDILRNYISSKIYIKAKNLKYRKFNRDLLPEIKQWVEVFNKFDIQITDQSCYFQDVIGDFEHFCIKRKGKLNILIADNFLSFKDKDQFRNDLTSMADYGMQQFLLCRQRSKGLIWILHHIKKEAGDKGHINTGYRLTNSDLKGSEAFERVSNHLILLNNPILYPDLMSQYSGDQKENLKRMFILDIGKNREDEPGDDISLIHFFCNLNHNIFQEIDLNYKEPIKHDGTPIF